MQLTKRILRRQLWHWQAVWEAKPHPLNNLCGRNRRWESQITNNFAVLQKTLHEKSFRNECEVKYITIIVRMSGVLNKFFTQRH